MLVETLGPSGLADRMHRFTFRTVDQTRLLTGMTSTLQAEQAKHILAAFAGEILKFQELQNYTKGVISPCLYDINIQYHQLYIHGTTARTWGFRCWSLHPQ